MSERTLEETGLPAGFPVNEQWELTPREVERRLSERSGDFMLLDCRTPGEHDLVRIEGSVHIPMSEIPARMDELIDSCDGCTVAVVCHHGRRSLQVATLMRTRGINAWSMAGGIDVWAQTIDRRLPRY